MCGIAGIVQIDAGAAIDRQTIQKMCDRLAHRGPDGEGLFLDPEVGLGHRRLAVIDLQTGNQPIFNEDRSICVVFNGEIYNFLQLRKQLEDKGHRFSTQTDTEVIVHLYEEEGVESVRSFRGMFAFALWDRKRKRLFLARDIAGEKPLYYTLDGRRLVFGSEIKALLAAGVGKEVDPLARDLFFRHSFIPGPGTIYQKIRSLPPAHFLTIDASGIQIRRYWEAPLPSDPPRSNEEYAEALRATLEEAVRIRLVSDVPLGAFLSGGIDSSIIAGLMKRSGPSEVKTFSIGFQDESYDETPYARQVAGFFQTAHHDERLDYRLDELLPKVIAHFDQPFGDSSALAVYQLSEMTRRSVTVALSGDGSDEIFAGYRRYAARKLLTYYWSIPRGIRRGILEKFVHLFSEGTAYYGGNLQKQLRLFIEASNRLQDDPLDLLPTTFTREEIARLYTDRPSKDVLPKETHPVHPLAACHSDRDPISRMMWIDFHSYLPDDILVKVDRMSMAHGLEVRCPFLDQKVIELAMRMPVDVKLRHLQTKAILRRAFDDLVPKTILTRRKHGFMLPLGDWFKGRLKGWLADVLFEPDKEGLLNRDFIAKLYREHQSGFRDHSQKLWLLQVFRLWEEQRA